jgi:hypothetical protein
MNLSLRAANGGEAVSPVASRLLQSPYHLRLRRS